MIRHLASIAEIVEDVDAALVFYEGLGLKVKDRGPEYAVLDLRGILHFGVWGRAAAAESTFGSRDAADRIPLGFSIGFEVDDVDQAGGQVSSSVLRGAADEPWGQRTLRFGAPSGALIEFSSAPWARELDSDVTAKATESRPT